MKKLSGNLNKRNSIIMIACCVTALIFSLSLSRSFAESLKPDPASPEMLRQGERMYREGILPSGKIMHTRVKGNAPVPGTSFACGSCHLRSGLGGLYENVYSPPITGKKLYQPIYRPINGIEQSKTTHPLRPAYTDETIAMAIRNGIDPAGRVLSDVMPRYILTDVDAMILINYLKSLSAKFSPGVTDTSIRFATIISDDANPAERDAMLVSLEGSFRLMNTKQDTVNSPELLRTRRMAKIMWRPNIPGSREFAKKNFLLSRWVLKGDASTWRAQLEEYYQKEPVFAILGGITSGDWQPIHQFCEDNRIPCLFPNTDLPVISDKDWYTLYLSKGYYQEGESVARYLASNGQMVQGKTIVQMVRSSREGRALADGFRQTWKDLGKQALVTVTLPSEKILSKDLLDQVQKREKPAVLIIWDDNKALPALESLAYDKRKPKLVFISSRYMGANIWNLKEDIRDFTYITYPFSFSPTVPPPRDAIKVVSDLQKTLRQADIPLQDNAVKIMELTNYMSSLLIAWLTDMNGNYYSDYLLDTSGKWEDQPYPVYRHISFGPGQRYVSRGCYIVQLSPGEKPALIKKSDWEM